MEARGSPKRLHAPAQNHGMECGDCGCVNVVSGGYCFERNEVQHETMSQLLTKFLGLVTILAVLWGVKEVFSYWHSFKASHPDTGSGTAAVVGPVSSDTLPGLPPNLEPL